MRRVGKSSWDSVNIHSLLSFRFSYWRQTQSLCEAVILQQELSACESCYEQLLLDSTWLDLRLEPETSLIRFCAAAVTVWSRAERAGWIFWKHLIRRRLKLLWNFFSFRLWVLIFMCQETSPPQPAARLRQPAVAGARAETEAGGKRKKRDRINGNFVAWHQNAASSSPEDRKWEKTERSVENSSDDGAHSITHYFIGFIMEKDINWYTLRFCFHVVNSIIQTLITSMSFGVLAGR